jgi:hypothetical protein
VVVEHTFVTLMEAPQTMQSAMQFLSAGGFARNDRPAFAVDPSWVALEMRRGKKKAARAKDISQLPQIAHVHWDRGRVTVALSIEPSSAWGGRGGGFQIGGSTEDNPKKMKLHTEMLFAIANGLEQVLTRNVAPEQAMGPWGAVEQEVRRVARKRRVKNAIIVGIFLAFVAGLVVLAFNAK